MSQFLRFFTFIFLVCFIQFSDAQANSKTVQEVLRILQSPVGKVFLETQEARTLMTQLRVADDLALAQKLALDENFLLRQNLQQIKGHVTQINKLNVAYGVENRVLASGLTRQQEIAVENMSRRLFTNHKPFVPMTEEIRPNYAAAQEAFNAGARPKLNSHLLFSGEVTRGWEEFVRVNEDTIRSFIDRQEIQELSWFLTKSGWNDKASQLSQNVLLGLKKSRITYPSAVYAGTQGKAISSTLDNGLMAVWRSEHYTFTAAQIKAEVALSRLDKLFSLERIPTTVLRTDLVPGKISSLRIYMKQGVSSNAGNITKDILFFDWITHSVRGLGTIRQLPNGYQFSVNSSKSAFIEGSSILPFVRKYNNNLRSIIPSDRVVQALKNTSEAEIKAALQGLLDQRQIFGVLLRRQKILDEVAKTF